ncbi:hypothetical protein IWW41_004045, partial [Coemansia sp. RSA 2522]
EAALCSQLLRFVCSASDLGSSIDAEAFAQGVAQWVGHCIETVENTEGATQQYGDSETINIRISTALTETIWALSIEWEPDTAEESDERWDDEKLGRLERNSRLIAITKGLLSADRHDTVRNSILALKEMRKSFPVILQYGRRIMNKFYEVAAGRTSGQGSTNNPNSDKNLKVLAASYSAFLGSAKQTWIPESKYYSMPVRATPTRSPHPTPAQPPTRQISRESVASDGTTKGDAQPRADSSQRMRQRPGSSRSGSGNQAVAAVAAATAAAAGASRTLSGGSSGSGHTSIKPSTRSSVSQRQGRNEGMARNGASESGRDHEQDRTQERDGSWGRSRDRQHGHQNEPESVSREDRLRRDSPARNNRSEEHSGAHMPKRSREELPVSSTLEPPRQRLTTSSAVELRTKLPVEAPTVRGHSKAYEVADTLCPKNTPFNRSSGRRQNRQDGGKPRPVGCKGQGDWEGGKRHRR